MTVGNREVPLGIEDYALIGDCESAALIGNGSIDWLCWPRFDSPACFSALLGSRKNGCWSIAPIDSQTRTSRRYRENTLILETDLASAHGAATLVDFMPAGPSGSHIVRLVKGIRGKIKLRSDLIARFEYGSLNPWIVQEEGGVHSAICGPDRLVLHSSELLRREHQNIVSEFTVSAGQTISFVLSYGPSWVSMPRAIDPDKALRQTESFWRDWIGQFKAEGEWSEAVLRSLIVLKALTHHRTGGIVAAPTTSLPEQLGGPRNWDYRYCWLRDATFTLLTLMNSGYFDEARSWREWLLRAVAGDPAQVQIMYRITGERRLTEWEVPWLTGYQGAKPVRIGNAAANQLQLDVYGEIMDALYHGRVGGLAANEAGWALQQKLVQHLETIWSNPDEGIWEVRGGPRHFTYSKVMAWVAFDRVIKTAAQFRLNGPIERWRATRDKIHDEVCRRAFNSDINAFVQSYDSTQLDASVLLLALVGFLPPSDARIRGTVEAIERHLMHNGFVLRYDPLAATDGLPGREGAFLACSFWLADNLVLLGRHNDARILFERLLLLRNDVGLLSEEYDPIAKRLVGNFPQAFSHITLVNTAHNLSRVKKPAEQRSGHSAQ